jgi:hypothetical protein
MSTNIDWSASLNYTGILTADSVLTFTDPPTVGCICTATLFEDGTGGRGTQWPAGVIFLEGDVPHPDLRPNRPTQFTFYFAGAGVYYAHSSRSKLLYAGLSLTTSSAAVVTMDSFTLKAKTIYADGQSLRIYFPMWGGSAGGVVTYQVKIGGSIVCTYNGAAGIQTCGLFHFTRTGGHLVQLTTGFVIHGATCFNQRTGTVVDTDTDLLVELQAGTGSTGSVDSGEPTVEYIAR